MNDGGPPTARNTSVANVEERARLRRNQRNSRARKQAYVQDLEQRWNECVRLGAQATVEMQREARRVQEENRLLRTLLHRQGVDDMAIHEAITVARQTERNNIPLPASHCSPEPPRATGINAAVLRTQNTNTPHPYTPDLPEGLAFVGNPAPWEAQSNRPQDLDFNHWLTDLCFIKDALGINMFPEEQLFQGGADQVGTSQGVYPDLAIHDAQHSQPLSIQDDIEANILDLLQEGDCSNSDWENTHYV
ncbi:hypothetical protein SAMD00023353_4800850 [Rosellinia necatrix]|uniref:BZIP domain-containing protein n=1 Tax=Rosellinia necatrix TaxID=77044 RepID=A0A1W2TQ96_ROSNE|nr:hypothetical protein SAMD00023353_4800850 [Rosellinia necatrix]